MTLRELMSHAKMMTDYEIERDFLDSLVPVARPQDRAALRAYRRARRKTPGFQPRSDSRFRTANSHSEIPDHVLKEIARTRECSVCGSAYSSKRADSLYCSDRCRKDSSRKKELAV